MIEVPFVALGKQFQYLRKELLDAFDSIGSSGEFIMGSNLLDFENEFSKFIGSDYAIGVANGSDALFLPLKALGIGAGDEVITCPNSFIASAWVIEACNAKPVFVDADFDMNINVDLIEEKITNKTKAILPVHLTGRPANMSSLTEICKKYNLAMIEDCAQAVGAKYNGQSVGTFGDAGGFSLHPLKNLGVLGDGGVITTNSTDLYESLLKLRNHGLINRDECDVWGYNSRLDSIQAKFALIKLAYLNQWNERFREIAKIYLTSLKDYVICPEDKEHEFSVYHNFVIKVDQSIRDDLMIYLLSKKIETKIHYPIPIHLQKCAKNLKYKEGDFPMVEKFAKEMISLPIYPELTNEQAEVVCFEVLNFMRGK